MRFNQILYSFCLLVLSTNSLSVELIKGYERSEIPRTIKKQMWNSDGGPFVADGLVQSNTENQYYWLFRSSSVSIYDTSSSRNLSAWPLTRWSYEPIESAVLEKSTHTNGGFSDLFLSQGDYLGCYHRAPLRYGDVENDGSSELVLFIGKDFFIFSPKHEKIIFMANLSVPDWFDSEETEAFFTSNGRSSTPSENPQFQSIFSSFPDKIIDPGLRGYAKLYFGDFDQNGQPDILVWRKLYESNMASDPIQGFHKLSDTFYHYETSATGEYLPQATNPTVIQSWLTAQNQTWQSGYPSKSECAGEEGQLILEMHDPLLNDPDVLR